VYSAKYLSEAGARIIAVSDSRGAILDKSGLDWEAVYDHKQNNDERSVVGFPGAREITNEDLIELDVDILIPAALENVITSENAQRVPAEIIPEAANGPVTPEADEILEKNGKLVIPDILANAGGVAVSYYEWVQNRNGDHWSVESVDKKLQRWMEAAFKSVWSLKEEYEVDMRSAADILAVRRIVNAYRVRGIWP
jgi:glutamate dehydrogenase/leucine dehydrogenase